MNSLNKTQKIEKLNQGNNNFPTIQKSINKKISDISIISNKNKFVPNTERKNLLLNNNSLIKDKIRKINNENSLNKEKRNVTNYSNNNNLLKIFNNNIIERKNKENINEEQFDNSKNYSLSSSYSLNYLNNIDKNNNNYNINKYYKNENKLLKSLSGNIKCQNNDNVMNNLNKSLNLVNLYKSTKDKYCYILNKKTNKEKIKKLNTITKSQNCNKIDSYNYKNNKINYESKIKYEKKERNLFEDNLVNSEKIFNDNSKNNINPLRNNNISNLNATQNSKYMFLQQFFEQNRLTTKQKAFYLLSTSPILRLNEQIILSYSFPIIKNKLSMSTILKNHEYFLEKKINELNEEINLCSDKIRKPFFASKIADVTLNFITSLDEQEFKDFDILTQNKEEIKLYYNFIKILYLLLDEKYNKNKDEKKIKNELFSNINDKGFKSLKDYLYYIYIGNQNKTKGIKYIEEINEIIKEEPNIIDNKYFFRICRFMAFSIYLIREIIYYANNIRDSIELKLRTKQFLKIIIEKYNKIKKRNKNIE